jgi:hypothetical protein
VGASGQVVCTIGSLAAGASGAFGLNVAQNDCSVVDGSGIVASARVTSTTADPNPAPNNTASATVQVSNPPPVITANGPLAMTVECHTSFTDPGASAVDACDGAVGVMSSGVVDPNTVGSYAVVYTAHDSAGGQAAPVVRSVQVADTTAPTLTVVDPQTMDPPNHKYHTFAIADLVRAASDTCSQGLGVADVVITQVSSDEPDNSLGDGNTTHDIVIGADCRSVQLRAERQGGGNGRVYTVALHVTDGAGNRSDATVKVMVPANGGASSAVDDGPQFTVSSACR